MIKSKSILFLFVIFLLANSIALIGQAQDTAVNANEKKLELVLGIDTIYKLDFVPHSKILIGNPSVIDYLLVPEKREIIFKALKPGTSSITVRDNFGDVRENFMITVTTTSQSQTVTELREFLGDVEGIDIGIKAGKVYVGGEIVVPSDIGRIETILENYKQVIRLYGLSPHTERVIVKKMQEEFKRFGLKDVTARLVNGVYWLEGVVKSDAEKDLAMKIAEGYVPEFRAQNMATGSARVRKKGDMEPIQNFISVNPEKQKPPPAPKMLKIVAQFVELTKDYNKIFGFKWMPTLATGGGEIRFGKTSTDGVTTNSDGTFSGTISNLFPRLASAKSAGYARVIQQGMVITENKKKAKITKDHQSPLVLGTGEFQQATTKNTGFNLEIDPSIVGDEMVEMSMGISVSMGFGSNGTTKNTVSTVLLVKSKDAAVVGGIAINETGTHYDKDPPNGKDTVENGFPLFSFLRSKSHAINKSQFVVFVTPEIIESPSQATAEIKQKFKQRRR